MAKDVDTPVADAGLARVIRDGLGGPALATMAALTVTAAALTAAWFLGSARSDLNTDASQFRFAFMPNVEATETFLFTAVIGTGATLALGVLGTAALWAAFHWRGLPLRKNAANTLAVLPCLVPIVVVTSCEAALVTHGWDTSADVILAATLGSCAGAFLGGLGTMAMTRQALTVLGASGRIERYHRSVVHALYGEGSRDRFLPTQVVALYRSGLTPEQAAALIRSGLSPERAAAAGAEAAATPALSDGWL